MIKVIEITDETEKKEALRKSALEFVRVNRDRTTICTFADHGDNHSYVLVTFKDTDNLPDTLFELQGGTKEDRALRYRAMIHKFAAEGATIIKPDGSPYHQPSR